MQHINRLGSENSPYLLQHANQPVHWFPWGPEAFEFAREHNKLVLVSIGYAACHWCHVMAHESFDDTEVADFMNRHLVAIKVDREEHPDVDQYYMDAVQLLNGQGGWPLNCFALPDGTAVFGGTYFPKERWVNVMESLVRTYNQQAHQVNNLAEELQRGMKKQLPKAGAQLPADFTKEEILEVIKNMEPYLDFEKGGIKGAPKFPLPSMYLPFITYYKDIPQELVQYLKKSLISMATGGIYDHLEGGFARYSVDEKWFVPHFEKMLYDNAQLIAIYSQTTQVTRIPYFAHVAEHIFEFLQNQLSHESGLCYASMDADSEGEEGAYYVWKMEELEAILGELFPAFELRYGITREGNWEAGKNLLHVSKSTTDVARERKRARQAVHLQLQHSLDVLKAERRKREAPAIDTKVLTAWNALLVAALVDLYKATRNTDYKRRAQKMMHTIMQEVYTLNGNLKRTLFSTKILPGNLEDYAYLSYALTRLYESSFDPVYAIKAREVAQQANELFWDANRKLFKLGHDEHPVALIPSYPVNDNVIPSANAVLSYVLKVLGFVFEDPEFTLRSSAMRSAVKKDLEKIPVYSGFWLFAGAGIDMPTEVAIVGPESELYYRKLQNAIPRAATVLIANQQEPLPWIKNRWEEGVTRVFVCYTGHCNQPAETLEQALEQLHNMPDK
ncbi:MAG: thioredoxin domain-containing protein [Bacteroidales bacterium]